MDECDNCGEYLPDDAFNGGYESRPGAGPGEWIADSYDCPHCGHYESF
jgi:hypothetical protein